MEQFRNHVKKLMKQIIIYYVTILNYHLSRWECEIETEIVLSSKYDFSMQQIYDIVYDTQAFLLQTMLVRTW